MFFSVPEHIILVSSFELKKTASFINKNLFLYVRERLFFSSIKIKKMEPEVDQKSEYGAESIQVLSGLDPVKKRPGMFIGSTDERGLHHLVYEVIDNSIDEAMAGHGKQIVLRLRKDGYASIEDEGRGMPVDIHPKYKIPGVQVILTMLHAGGKFGGNSAYKVSGGLHGVGVSVTNALSEHLIVEVKRNNKIYRQEYKDGNPVSELQIVGESTHTGTTVIFKPSVAVFDTTNFHFDTLKRRLRELAFLNKGLEIVFIDERTDKSETFKYEGGIKEFVAFLNNNKTKLGEIIYFEKAKNDIIAETALQYTDGFTEQVFTFANNINTHEGGSHLTGFKTALTRSLNTYAEKKGLIPNELKFNSDDFREGLTAIISVKMPNPQFEGQTKTKLGNSEIKGIVDTIVSASLNTYLEEHPSEAKLIISKCLSAARAREAAKKARELVRRKSILGGTGLPGKLWDCSSKDNTKTELYLVEGDSAAGTAKSGRIREFQAILPLRGKVINVEKARLFKVLKNNEISTMITAIGTSIGEDFDINKIRYGKIIIMTDADVDGSHISCLLLTFFYRFMNPLIEAGKIYLAQPPLYKLQKGKQVRYVYTDDEKEKALVEMGEGVGIQRYKGLGEMDAEQLWDTTMDPSKRLLKKIEIDDAVRANEIFETLMGDEVEARREFIMEHADDVGELDI